MARNDLGEKIASGFPGYSIWDQGERLALRYPLGTTRIEWAAVDGRFQPRSDNTVTLSLKREWLARRSAFYRFSVRIGRGLYNTDMRIRASQFGTSAEQLATTLNTHLAMRVGTASQATTSETPSAVSTASAGPLLRLYRLFLKAVFAFALVLLLIQLLH